MPSGVLARPVVHERTNDDGRVAGLDALRGLAILAVVAFHVAVVSTANAAWAHRRPPPIHLWPFFAGSLGVDVFFVLSGFLVLRSWRSIRRRRGAVLSTAGEFARRRARRLLPPYWFALVVLIVWRAPEWLSSARGLRNIAMFASLNQFVDPDLPRKLNTVTWSLTTETHFYLLVPLLALVFLRGRWMRLVVALLAAAVVWRATMGGTGGAAEWIFGRVDQFGVGMAAAVLVDDHRSSRVVDLLRGRAAPWVLGSVLGAAALTHGALRLVPKPGFFLVLLHPIVGVAIAGLLVRGMITGSIGRISWRPLRSLGAVSYSLYLWHWPLLAEGTRAWGTSSVALAALLGASLVIAGGSYVLFERPLLRPTPGVARGGPRAVGARPTLVTSARALR